MYGKVKKVALGVAALSGAAVGGAAAAGAATSNSGATTAPQSMPPPPRSMPAPPKNMPAPGTAAHEDAEKPVTGDAAAKAQAAAVEAAGGGTAGDVTTDYIGKGYEVTVTKSDGSKVEIHLDSSFHVLGPPGGHPGGPPPPPPSGSAN